MAGVMTAVLQPWVGRAACIFVMLALAQAPAGAAVITLANGEVIDGTIQGRVLTRRFTGGDVAFRMLEGKDISSIDESGIRATGDSVMLVGMKGATQEDVLQGLIIWNEGRRLRPRQALVRDVGTAQVIGARVDNATMKPFPEEFLGEYRIDEAAKKIELLASVRLKTANGAVVTIQLAEIVRFKQ